MAPLFRSKQERWFTGIQIPNVGRDVLVRLYDPFNGHNSQRLPEHITQEDGQLGSTDAWHVRPLDHKSFTRPSVAKYTEDGVVKEAASGVLRDPHNVDANDGSSYSVALLEDTRTNELLRSEELGATAWGSWNDGTVDADVATAPDGNSTADRVNSPSGTSGSDGGIQQSPSTESPSVDNAFSVYVKADSFSEVQLKLDFNGGTRDIQTAKFDLSVGAVLSDDSSGGANIEEIGSGWYRCWIVGTDQSGDNTGLRCVITIAEPGSGTNSVFTWGAQCEVGVSFPTSYIPTTDAVASREDDFLQDDAPFVPTDIENAGALTILTEWVELGTFLTGGDKVATCWNLGVAIDQSAHVGLTLWNHSNHAVGEVRTKYYQADGTLYQCGVSAGISMFDFCQALVDIEQDGNGDWIMTLEVWVNGTSQGTDTRNLGSDLPDSWTKDLITVGAADDGVTGGFTGLRSLTYSLDSSAKTLSEMEPQRDLSDPYWRSNPKILLFDGDDDRIEVPNPPLFNLTRPFEVVALVRAAAGDGNRVIYSSTRDGQTNSQVLLRLNGSEGIEGVIVNESGTTFTAGGDTILSDGSFHTVNLVFDGTDLKIVVDTSEEATTATPSGDVGGIDTSRIGNKKVGSETSFYDDQIGIVAVYNGRTLAVDERKRLHNWLRNRGYTDLSYVER